MTNWCAGCRKEIKDGDYCGSCVPNEPEAEDPWPDGDPGLRGISTERLSREIRRRWERKASEEIPF